MNLNTTKTIILDFYDKKYITVDAKQFDKSSRYLLVTCTNQGTPFPLDENSHAVFIRYKKADGYAVFNSCSITEDGSILVELSEQMLASPGNCCADLIICEIKSPSTADFLNITNDGELQDASDCIISTMKFYVNVIDTPYDNCEIESRPEFSALNNLLANATKDCKGLIEEMQDYVRTAKNAKNDAGKSANASANSATKSEDFKKESAASALESANSATASANSALESANSATTSANSAAASANSAAASANSADTSANCADASANSAANAANSAANAADSAANAAQKADSAAASAITAEEKAIESSDYAVSSKSYAVGSTNTRENEETDNAKYYYQQARAISESFAGALRPMGTVSFANLPALSSVVEGNMYNISDQFTTDDNFKEGPGSIIPAGSNVYKTADGKWDVLAGTPVTGVKGNAQSDYQKGNVNLTPADIGLGNVNNTSDANKPISTAQQTALNAKVSKSGDTMTGELKLNNYLTLNAWNGYGNGSAKAWYNGNSKTIDFEGDVKNIDLNAISATNADTVDGKHASDLQNFRNLTNNPISTASGSGGSAMGWYKIARTEGTHDTRGDYRSNYCEVTITRSYNSPAPEILKFMVLCDWSNLTIEPVFAHTQTKIWTQLRVTMDASGQSYIEVYQDRAAANSWYITVEILPIQGRESKWKAMPPTLSSGTSSTPYTLNSLPNELNATKVPEATKATQDGNGNNIASTYLPLSGGTITGNIRLKGSGNYGNKINFGDGDYVYLYEDTDDHLVIKGNSGIDLVTNNDCGISINGTYLGSRFASIVHNHNDNLGIKKTLYNGCTLLSTSGLSYNVETYTSTRYATSNSSQYYLSEFRLLITGFVIEYTSCSSYAAKTFPISEEVVFHNVRRTYECCDHYYGSGNYTLYPKKSNMGTPPRHGFDSTNIDISMHIAVNVYYGCSGYYSNIAFTSNSQSNARMYLTKVMLLNY